ncbi:MAG: hypothetical protein ACUVQG_06695 [Thermogutta sp.]
MNLGFVDSPLENYVRRTLVVKRYAPDSNDLAWSTMTHLLPEVIDPCCYRGTDNWIEGMFRIVLASPKDFDLENVFANPAWVVRLTSGCATKRFFVEARKAQRAWFKQSADMLQSNARTKRAAHAASPIIRQLMYTGVLILDGKHVFPNRWPESGIEEKPRQDLVGHRFGRLVVDNMLSRGRCHCTCDCGRSKIVRRTHLVAGRTGSCGCLREEVDERLTTRRQRRGWLHG